MNELSNMMMVVFLYSKKRNGEKWKEEPSAFKIIQIVSLEMWLEQIMIWRDESNEKVREKRLCQVSETTAQNRQHSLKKT